MVACRIEEGDGSGQMVDTARENASERKKKKKSCVGLIWHAHCETKKNIYVAIVISILIYHTKKQTNKQSK
jgi:hypothetical protein